VEEEDPWNGGWAKDGAAEEPARVAGASAAGREAVLRGRQNISHLFGPGTTVLIGLVFGSFWMCVCVGVSWIVCVYYCRTYYKAVLVEGGG
jgi:hypothetical protein